MGNENNTRWKDLLYQQDIQKISMEKARVILIVFSFLNFFFEFFFKFKKEETNFKMPTLAEGEVRQRKQTTGSDPAQESEGNEPIRKETQSNTTSTPSTSSSNQTMALISMLLLALQFAAQPFLTKV